MPSINFNRVFFVAMLMLIFVDDSFAFQPRCAANASVANVRVESVAGNSRVHVRFEISHSAWFERQRQRAAVGLRWGFEYADPSGRVHRWHGTGLEYFANRSGSISTFSTMSHAYHAPVAEVLDVWVEETTCHVTG